MRCNFFVRTQHGKESADGRANFTHHFDREHQREPSHDRSRDPKLIEVRDQAVDRQAGKDEPTGRFAGGFDAQTNKLTPGAVVLGQSPQLGAAEETHPHLQVPTIEFSAPSQSVTIRAQGSFPLGQPFLDRLRFFRPDGETAVARKGEATDTPVTPRVQAAVEPAAKPRDRLEQVQTCNECTRAL